MDLEPQEASAYVRAEVSAEMGRQRLSQLALGRRIGKTEDWIGARLRGRDPIDFKIGELARIAVGLGVPISQFIPPVRDHRRQGVA